MNPGFFLNGTQVTDGLSASRGLHYGDGVFRTCLIYGGKVIDIKEQIEKIVFDSQRLGLQLENPKLLEIEAQELASGHPQAVLKILLLRSTEARGYRYSEKPVDRLLCLYPAPQYPARNWEQGIAVFRTSFRLAAQPALAGIKHLNRLEQVLASRHWEPDAEEGIVEDDQGRPLCGTRSNLFWVARSSLRTPSLDRCGVAGLMRDKVLRLAQNLQIPCQISEGSWDELQNAKEVFVTNSLVGIWPVRALEGNLWSAPGPVTRRLSETIAHPRLASKS